MLSYFFWNNNFQCSEGMMCSTSVATIEGVIHVSLIWNIVIINSVFFLTNPVNNEIMS